MSDRLIYDVTIDVTKLQVARYMHIYAYSEQSIDWPKNQKTDPSATRGQRANINVKQKQRKQIQKIHKQTSNKIEFNKMLEHRLHIDDDRDDNEQSK